jgi:hypothetical protein
MTKTGFPIKTFGNDNHPPPLILPLGGGRKEKAKERF